jgi:hypothetical protein
MTVEKYIKQELINLGYASGSIYINRFNTLSADTSILQNGDKPFTIAIAMYDDYSSFETLCGSMVNRGYYNIAVRGSGDTNKDNEFLEKLFKEIALLNGDGDSIISVSAKKRFIPLLINERDVIGYYCTVTVDKEI